MNHPTHPLSNTSALHPPEDDETAPPLDWSLPAEPAKPCGEGPVHPLATLIEVSPNSLHQQLVAEVNHDLQLNAGRAAESGTPLAALQAGEGSLAQLSAHCQAAQDRIVAGCGLPAELVQSSRPAIGLFRPGDRLLLDPVGPGQPVRNPYHVKEAGPGDRLLCTDLYGIKRTCRVEEVNALLSAVRRNPGEPQPFRRTSGGSWRDGSLVIREYARGWQLVDPQLDYRGPEGAEIGALIAGGPDRLPLDDHGARQLVIAQLAPLGTYRAWADRLEVARVERNPAARRSAEVVDEAQLCKRHPFRPEAQRDFNELTPEAAQAYAEHSARQPPHPSQVRPYADPKRARPPTRRYRRTAAEMRAARAAQAEEAAAHRQLAQLLSQQWLRLGEQLLCWARKGASPSFMVGGRVCGRVQVFVDAEHQLADKFGAQFVQRARRLQAVGL